MAFQGPLIEYSNSITDRIDDYYTKNKYIEFKPDPTMVMNNTLPSITKRSQFKLMTKTKEYDTVTPVKMSLFDNNLYNIETATYNTSLYFSKMKKEEQELIRSGATVINELEGLVFIMKTGYLMSVEDFLKSQYSNSTQTESFVSGSSGAEYNNDISIKKGESTTNKDDKNLSFIDMISNKIKINIWNNDDDTNTLKEGLDSGLTYKAYSGYVDNEVKDNTYFTDNKISLKNGVDGQPITGVTTNFSGSNNTGGKVDKYTYVTMTTLNGYLFTKSNGGGAWTFSINSDDMSLLVITDTNGVKQNIEKYDRNNKFIETKNILEDRGYHGLVLVTGKVNLLANTYYKIELTTGNNYGPGELFFSFKPPGFTNWITNNNDGYFTTEIPASTFKSAGFDSTTIKTSNNTDLMSKLYETAKNAALSAVSSIKATTVASKPFVMANPEVPGGMITVFPPVMAGNNQRTKTGQFNSLDWSKISSKAELSAEWFGYLKANVSGTYYIKMESNRPHISNLWIGENALVNYTLQNADINNCGSLDSTGMFLSGQQERTTHDIKVIAGNYYPIRIHYSQTSSTTIQYNFNVYILKLNSDGSKSFANNSTAYFCSLTDNKNVNYEPIQMAMALRNDKNETNPALFNCYVSPINTSNNYTNNQNLRKVRGQDSKIFKSFNLTPKDKSNSSNSKLTLTSNGDLVFSNGISNRSITGKNLDNEDGSVKNANCDNMCSLPNYNTRNSLTTPGAPAITDVNIYNLSVKENSDGSGENLLTKFVSATQTEMSDPTYGKYISISLTVDKANYEEYYSGINRGATRSTTVVPAKDMLDSCYVFYTINKSNYNYKFDYDSTKKLYTKTINNLAETKSQYLSAQTSGSSLYDTYKNNYQTAMNSDAQNCVNKVSTDCNFYSGITNDGEITISNALGTMIWGSKQPGRLISNLGASYSSAIPAISSLKSVSDWLADATKLKNYYIYSASYANPHDTTPFKSTSIGKGQTYEVLYSPNGKFKLTLENGTLELKYAVSGDTYMSSYTNNDGSQSFMLYLISADEKMGNVYLANSDSKTMYEMKNDKTKILKYANTFSGSTANANYQYPPYSSESTAINSTSYTKTNQSKSDCEKSCVSSDSCTHYYSFTTQDGNAWCMTNTDKSPEQYYNKIPELKSSNLYIRDKMIDSTCSYSADRCDKYKNVSLLTNSKSNTNDTFNNYNKGYDVIYTRDLHNGQVEDSSSEGACGVPSIYSSLANLVGPEEKVGEYKFNNMSCSKEGFSTFSPLLSSDVIKVTEGFNVTGYTESNSCKMVDEYVNSIDINPATYSSMLQNCKNDLLKNVTAIENYWAEFNKDNNKINNYYNDITSGVVDVNKKDAIINNDSIVPKTVNYDSIDFSGNLLLSDTLKNATSLKDGRIKDERENITQEMMMYLISIMALISLFIFLIFVTSFE